MCHQPPGTDVCITFKSSLMRGRFTSSLRRCAPSSLLVASSSLPHARMDAIPRLDLAAVAGDWRRGSPQPGRRRPARPTASSYRRAASAPSSAEVPAGGCAAWWRARAAASWPATVAASSLRRRAPFSLLVASSSLPHARVDAIPRFFLPAIEGHTDSITKSHPSCPCFC